MQCQHLLDKILKCRTLPSQPGSISVLLTSSAQYFIAKATGQHWMDTSKNSRWPTLGAHWVHSRDGRGGARTISTGQGEGKNPKGGAKERVNRLIQKFDKSA